MITATCRSYWLKCDVRDGGKSCRSLVSGKRDRAADEDAVDGLTVLTGDADVLTRCCDLEDPAVSARLRRRHLSHQPLPQGGECAGLKRGHHVRGRGAGAWRGPKPQTRLGLQSCTSSLLTP